mgnify:CR=1 FL=1
MNFDCSAPKQTGGIHGMPSVFIFEQFIVEI